MLSPLRKNLAICCFEPLVNVLRAADEPDAGKPVAPGLEPFEGGARRCRGGWPGRGSCWRRS